MSTDMTTAPYKLSFIIIIIIIIIIVIIIIISGGSPRWQVRRLMNAVRRLSRVAYVNQLSLFPLVLEIVGSRRLYSLFNSTGIAIN